MASSTEQITVDGVAYDYQYIPDTKIRAKSKLVAISKVIWSYLRNLATTLHNTYLAQLWPNSGYLLIGGIRYNTIEGIIGALAANGADAPASGSAKFFTAGGAYADKSDMPVSGSSKTFTAGGAYADKAYVPEANSTKNFTAGGAFADKADVPAEGDTRCLTSGGAYAYKTSAPAQGSKKGFQVDGIRIYTMLSPNARSWLGKLYGTMLGWQWSTVSALNGVPVNDFCYNPVWDLYMAAGVGADGDHKGVWWSTGSGGFNKGTGASMNSTIEAIACTGAVDGYESTPMAVAATWSGGLIYSTDGKDWRYAESNSNHQFKFNTVYCKESVSGGIVSAIWLAGSDEHGIWWSEDGKNWTQVAGTDGHAVNHIIGTRWARHRDLVVVACTDSGVLVSTDGKNWTDANITDSFVNSNFNAKKAVFANFADAVGNDVSMVTVIGTDKINGEGIVLRSTDKYCTSWAYASTSQNYEPMDVAAGWGKVVIALKSVSGTSNLMVANIYRAHYTDAVAYTTCDIPDSLIPVSIFYANGIWVCACESPNGQSAAASALISVDNCKTMDTVVAWADNAFKRVWYAAGRWFLTTSTGLTRVSEPRYLNFND